MKAIVIMFAMFALIVSTAVMIIISYPVKTGSCSGLYLLGFMIYVAAYIAFVFKLYKYIENL